MRLRLDVLKGRPYMAYYLKVIPRKRNGDRRMRWLCALKICLMHFTCVFVKMTGLTVGVGNYVLLGDRGLLEVPALLVLLALLVLPALLVLLFPRLLLLSSPDSLVL